MASTDSKIYGSAKTYEITWLISGRTERVSAHSLSYPSDSTLNKAAHGHIQFWLYVDGIRTMAFSAPENQLRSVRFIPDDSPEMVTKRWDNGVIEVEQRWLDRAKYLLKLYGPVSTIPARLLELEMRIPSHSGSQHKLLVIADRELHAEGYKHRSLRESCCPICR